MRHNKSGKKLGIKRNHFNSMFKNMCNSFIKYKIIKTTTSKAKEFRRIIEPLINKSKINSISNKRYIFNFLRNKDSLKKLFYEISPIFKETNGGYVKIIKCGFRKGDNSEMSFILLSKNIK